MKFLIPLTLLAAAGVSAQDKSCEADYIVTQCLSTETVKVRTPTMSPSHRHVAHIPSLGPSLYGRRLGLPLRRLRSHRHVSIHAIHPSHPHRRHPGQQLTRIPRSCYNNCPNDPRASPARGQVTNFCANAAVYGTKAKAKAAATATAATAATATPRSATATDEPTSNAAAATTASASPTQGTSKAQGNSKAAATSSAKPTSTNAAEALSGGAGGMFVAVAGLVAALL